MNQDWIHLQQSKKYLQATSWNDRVVIKRDGVYGVRRQFCPRGIFRWIPIVTIEWFASYECPRFVPEQGLKILYWNRIDNPKRHISHHQKEPGFLKILGITRFELYPVAYLDLRKVTLETYFKSWGHMRKNFRTKWKDRLAQNAISIHEVSLEDFRYHYIQSDVKPSILRLCLHQLNTCKGVYKDDIKFYLVKNQASEVIGGTVIVHDKETRQSVYQFAFMTKEKEYQYVGVGLIVFCVEDALNNGFQFLNLTGIWTPGYPKDWKGFTAFKMQFHPRIIRCGETYMQIRFTR